MAERSKHGYLVLADISGYTSFLAKVELEHAQEILTDLLETIIERFRAMLTISKLEGDAVFAYVDESFVTRGETLLELVEQTYVAFRQRRDSSKRMTTCTCKACQTMPSLELKFFVHHGDYMLQTISGIKELVGSDVNLVHRLMKNHITENTGWKAYALFTKAAMERLKLELEDVHMQVESYEHLGDIDTVTVDMISRYEAIARSQDHSISKKDADFSMTLEFNIPQVKLWEILTDPVIKNELSLKGTTWLVIERPRGRTGAGAVNHCAHGRGIQQATYLDWNPFEYFTTYNVDGRMKWYEYYEVKPRTDKNASTLTVRWKSDFDQRWLGKLLGYIFFKPIYYFYTKWFEPYYAKSIPMETGQTADE